MNWFFALNENGSGFADYAKMLKVAVHTALTYTSLSPNFLYDGKDNELTAWLKDRGVNIIHCHSSFYEQLNQIAVERGDKNILGIGAGSFLRTEIPQITLQLNIKDDYVLYTDVDVMFLSEVVDTLEEMKPEYFAVAPENTINNYRKMNTGVMLMNLRNLRENDAAFKKFIAEEIHMMVCKGWDQDAYKLFYKKKFWGFNWNKLPEEFNWKPYWGNNSLAKIVHFHGPKPFQKQNLSSEKVPEHLKPLLHLVSDEYFRLCDIWEKFNLETAK